MENKNVIAYLAPELPSLSATFVYNEILALECRGYHVLPISIHKPKAIASEVEELAARSYCLYPDGVIVFLVSFFINIAINPKNLYKSCTWLLQDIKSLGFINKDSIKLLFQFLAANRLARILISESVQHIHIHFAHVPTQVGMYAAKISGISFSVTSHANDIFERGLLLKTKAERSSCFATISLYNKNYLLAEGVPDEKIKIIRCGVNLKYTGNPKPTNNKIFKIGSLGRLVEKKGMNILLSAVKLLKDQGYSVELEIAGDGPLKENLLRMANELKISDRVVFLGAINHSNVAEWLSGLDAFVLACIEDSNGDKDGLPVSLMEAMSQQIVTISTNLSGIPELIKHNATGLLAKPGDSISLAEQIKIIITNLDLSRILAQSGKEYVYTEFSQESNIDRLIQCF